MQNILCFAPPRGFVTFDSHPSFIHVEKLYIKDTVRDNYPFLSTRLRDNKVS